MKVISTETAPAAIGPYSQAIVSDGVLYTSGQIPLNPETGAIAGTGIETRRTGYAEACCCAGGCRHGI